MEKTNMQHVQLPNGMNKINLKPKELLVYASIKRFMNESSKEAFPSLETIAELSECKRHAVLDTIKTLVKHKYISVRKEGRRNIYKFSEYKTFEVFSYDFLDAKDLDTNEKAYLLAIQQFLYKDNSGETHNALTTLGTMEIAELINMSYNTLKKIEGSLVLKGYLNQLPCKIKDKFNLVKVARYYQLDKFQQQIVFAFRKVGEKFEQQDKINDLVMKEIKALKDKIAELEKEKKERDNYRF